MKKPVKDYKVDYPVDDSLKQYYGNCENCNENNSTCIGLNIN